MGVLVNPVDCHAQKLNTVFCYILLYYALDAKRSPYSIAERRVPQLIPVLGSQPAGDVSHKPGGRLHYFPPGLQLPSLLPILLLGEQRHNGCEQFA